MKSKLTLVAVLLLCTLAGFAQTRTAYEYYFINKNLGSKDVYVFTTPMPFKYQEGSTYVFAPPEFEKAAQRLIENKLSDLDASSNGLYSNQVSNGSNTSFTDLQSTNQEIKNKMLELYASQKSRYRSTDIEIILIDAGSGALHALYSLEATKSNTNNGSAGNAN